MEYLYPKSKNMKATNWFAVEIGWRIVAISTLFILVLLSANPAFAEEWKSAAPIPKGAEEVYGIAAGGKLYVFGGLGLDWKAMGMVMEYNPDTDRWTRKRDMPQYLHHVALAEAGGRIYMFGGFTLPEKGKAMWVPVNQAWEYDPKADKWKALPPLPVARGSANALHVNGRIHVVGGATLPPGTQEEWVHPSRIVAVGTHDVYDLASNTWTKAASIAHAPQPRSRRHSRQPHLYHRRARRLRLHSQRIQHRPC
jgi:hypothetical protein